MDLANYTFAGFPANSASAAMVIDPQPVPNAVFDTESYLGLWQQAYASQGVAAWNFRCVTGEYGAVPGNDDAVTVENNSCFPTPFDRVCIPANIKGFASRSSAEDASKSSLQVNLRAEEPQPFNDDNVNYTIFGVGPLNEDGLYSWATIYCPDGSGNDYMYILVRDLETFKGSEQEVAAKDWARTNGFSFEGEDNMLGAPPVIESNWNNCN